MSSPRSPDVKTIASDVPTYSERLGADEQLSAEERIASTIFERAETGGCDGCGTISEEDAAQLGRDILRQILMHFRADLFASASPPSPLVETAL